MKELRVIFLVCILMLLSSCVTFRSDIKGKYTGEIKKQNTNGPVTVLFVFSHVKQVKGLDTVPKLQKKYGVIGDFNIIFSDALREFNNLKQYDMFTDDPDDVNEPKRRLKKDSLMTSNDYTIQVRIEKTDVFYKQFFSTSIATVTATMFPVPYTTKYTLEAKVFNNQRKLINTYHRETTLSKWVQTLLIFAYPFYPEEREIEETYVILLHDVFKQIENEGILIKQ